MNRLFIIIAFFIMTSIISNCTSSESDERNYRQDMRDFVQAISNKAKGIKSSFIIIPQNGHELLTENGEANGTWMTTYINTLDGIGREDLLYGYTDDNVPTPESETNDMMPFMDIAEDNGIEVLVTDYCWTYSFVDDSYFKNNSKGYISFAASHRELDNIPAYPAVPYHLNDGDIDTLTGARNFLYLLNPGTFPTKESFLNAIKNTDYDLLIIDLFYNGNEALSSSEIESLKKKANGGHRLVIAYMSIGEAEDYRYYWQEEWETDRPEWIVEENEEWPGNYIVCFWDENWEKIIFQDENSYLNRIIDAGFDGAYLDIIDAYEYFEDQ